MMNSVFILLKRFAKSALTENMGLKAVAALFAVLFFFLVMFQETAEQIVDVEVIWTKPEPTSGLVVSSELPEKLRIRLKGPRSTIESLKSGSNLDLKVDLRNREEGTSHHYFAQEDFEIPQRTEFVRVTPESVLVKLERIVTRRLPIHTRTYGKLQNGTEFAGNPVISPSTVTVVGPASAMRNLSIVETEDIDIEGFGPGEHQFIVPARRIDGVTMRRGDEIKIIMKVRWIPGQRMLSSLLLSARGTELVAEFKPKEVAVALSGPKIELDKLDPAKIVPVVIVPEDQKNRIGIFSGEVTLEGLPDNVFATSVAPTNVQVRLTGVGAVNKKKVNKEQ